MAGIASTSALQLTQLQSSSGNEDEEFIYVRATMRVPIAPVWSSTVGSDGLEGVREILAGWLMRYLPPLQLVLLTFGPVPTLTTQASEFPASSNPFPTLKKLGMNLLNESEQEEEEEEEEDEDNEPKKEKMMKFQGIPIIAGSGFGLAQVEWQGLGWRPRLGHKLTGTPTLCTPSHISLLLHNLFNATIPSTHIPEDVWFFDPEYPIPARISERREINFPSLPIAVKTEHAEELATERVPVEGEAEPVVEPEVNQEETEKIEIDEEEDLYRESGWWLNRITKEPLGGDDGVIQFTVVGLTIANSTISVTGSLLAKPFEVPIDAEENSEPAKRARSASASSGSENEEEVERVVEPPVLVKAKKVKVKEKKEKEVKKAKKVKV